MLTGPSAVLALDHGDLVPPPRPAQFTDGATAALRDAMARFSGPDVHAARRAPILELVAGLDLGEVAATAATLAGDLEGDVASLSWHVPTYTLVAMLRLDGDREQIRADVETIAKVIGRNEPTSPASDAATERLLEVCADHGDPVATVSVLYQNHDATASLIRAEAEAALAGGPGLVGASTKRVAMQPVTLGELDIAAGDEVTVDLTGMPFGSGPHQCPGRELAEAIARGVVSALRDR